MTLLNKIADIIRKNRSFLIVAHDNLDGDSLGSELALGLALENMDKDVRILLEGPIPIRYKFLPGLNKLIAASPINKKADVLFVLDTAGWNQIEKFNPEQFKDVTVINIDHHIDNHRFGNINWIDSKASAVGEQIFNLLKKLSIPLTKDIAVCLYTAIITDTGSFQYSNTTANTHKIISQLVNCSISPHLISKQIYENIHLSKLQLLQLSLKTLKLKEQIIWIWITRKMLKETNAKKEDTDGFINYLNAVRNIKVAVVFKEDTKPGTVRVTFRSKNPEISVNEIAHQFGGGGHPAAAGCTVRGSRKEVEQRIIKAVQTILKNVK